ncbi:MAG: hypothetical protein KC563_10800, partial [Nitrospira sp.]|nr:hypothetical protein [Nitrospira sp.]
MNRVSMGLEVVHRHTVLVLTVLFGMCLLTIYLHMSQLRAQMVTAMSLQGAEIYTRALEEIRQWYTTEVVQRLHGQGVV